MEKLKDIAWHLVSTQLVLAVVIIFCPCLCGNLGAETARKFLTPNLSPSTEPAVSTKHHFTLRAPSPCRPSPLLLCSGISRPGNPGHCPWLASPSPLLSAWCPLSLEPRLLRTAAAAIPACSCCSESGQQGSVVLPLRTAFFPLTLENSVGLCQLRAWCQLPPVCPRCFCLGTLCTQAPAESHTPDCKPVIPSDDFRHLPILLVPFMGPFFSFLFLFFDLSVACMLLFPSWSTLCHPMVYSPPDASAHGIFQPRTLE